MKIGVFVGSLDPFTIGHDSIVRRALPLFDRLVIGVVGDNVHKPSMRAAEERMKVIQDLYADDQRVIVKPFHGLAMDFAKAENARFIVKVSVPSAISSMSSGRQTSTVSWEVLRLFFSIQNLSCPVFRQVLSESCHTLVWTLVPTCQRNSFSPY